MEDDHTIRVERLVKLFDNHKPPVLALDGVSLVLRQGEFLAIIGPSGCGKSTLLRIISDLTDATSGQVHVMGRPAESARRDCQIAMVFQSPALLPWRTVGENIELPREIQRDVRGPKTQELVDLVGLHGFENALPRHLSGGMQARVALARALAISPEILLLDEPFGNLDEMTRAKMHYELLRILMTTNSSVLLVTHSIHEAVYLSDRILVMTHRPGRIRRETVVPFGRPRTPEIRKDLPFVQLVEELRSDIENDELLC